MDANGTRYHLLLGQEDWTRCFLEICEPQTSPLQLGASGIEWRTAQYEVALRSRVFRFTTSLFDDTYNLDRRRGAGRDRYGNWYWIAESGKELRVQSSGTGRSAHFWSAEDGAACELPVHLGAFGLKESTPGFEPLVFGGLAVTADHYLVVGVLKPKGLLIFDLHASGPPRQVLWPEAVPFAPFDIAPRPGGGVWILDRANRCYWGLDRKLNVESRDLPPETVKEDIFQPVRPEETRRTAAQPFPDAITLASSSPIAGHDPVAIDALPDGTVLILDNWMGEKFSHLLRYHWSEELGAVSLEAVCDVIDEDAPTNFGLIGYDLAFVPAEKKENPALLGQALIAASDGNQTYVFDVLSDDHGLWLQALAQYYPMRLFGGKAIVTAGNKVYYDFGESWLPLIEQKRPRYETEASLYTFPFDGKLPDCTWHRLMIDACIPPDSSVRIWSRAANEKRQLESKPWLLEPPLHRRAEGSELPFAPQSRAADTGTWELLFQRATGRYLQLKITLSGNGRSTPRLRALRAYYPRFSYLEHYLPAIYQEDETSAWFLDRFLANMEGTLTGLEDKIANVQALFDVRSAPADVLEWLASWLGIVLDPAWEEPQRRLFIKNAMKFFQYRGTMRGLLMALHLALDSQVDECIFTQPLIFGSSSPTSGRAQKLSGYRIIEKFRTRQTPPVVLGDPSEAEGLRVVEVSQRWAPAQGRDALNARWKEATGSTSEFPTHDPGGAQSEIWRSFSQAALGFIPRAQAGRDESTWQEFLANRYGTIQALNTAYGLPGSAQFVPFEDITLPDVLPNDGAQLIDWYEFEGTVLPTQHSAHRFTVMLPAPLHLTDAQRHERLEIAQRVIDFEKPAHTTFDVKFYWAMFRVGEARLGEDTVIDLGGRNPDLMPPFILGRDYLSQGYLSPGHPRNVSDRLVLDRDRLNDDPGSTHHI